MQEFDLVVIGGGPAGIAAATAASNHNLNVLLIDERSTLGGQIYKRVGPGFEVKDSIKLGADYLRGEILIKSLTKSNAEVMLETTVLSVEDSQVIVVTADNKYDSIKYKKLLITPGAYDRPVVFPGWTLPGVITAGAAQSLVKTQRVLPGSRIFFAGSGPLALAFPAQLSKMGANIVGIIEAAPRPGLVKSFRIARSLRGNLDLIRDAFFYQFHLVKSRIRIKYGRIIVSANGTDRLESITYARVDKNWRPISGTEKTVPADTLCIGYGFFPSVELFKILNCEMSYDESRGGTVVQLDEWGSTSLPNVFGAGDGTGVSGSYVAILNGQIAALRIAYELDKISEKTLFSLSKSIRKEVNLRKKFQKAINHAYAVKSGIYQLASSETIICRCESIPLKDLLPIIESTSDFSVVKAYSRCGMGLCQGRNCQRQVSALIAAKHGLDLGKIPGTTPRFPAKPVLLGQIADSSIRDEKYFIDEQ